MSDEDVKTMPALLNHLSNLWKRRPEWCASDRLDLRCVSTSRSERSNIGARSSRAKWIPVWNARQSVRWSGRTRSGPFRRMSLYGTNKLLWNSKSASYHNKSLREDAWREISSEMGVPVPELKKKMTVLLSSYRREKRRISKSQITGSGRDSIYVSKWFGFDDFNFMQDKCSPNYTTDTMQTSKKRKQEEEDDKMLREAFKILTEPSQVTDPYFSYGQHIANELRKYDSHTLIYVKQAINNIIFEADLGKYSPLYGYTTQEPQNFSSSNTDSLASTSTQANENRIMTMTIHHFLDHLVCLRTEDNLEEDLVEDTDEIEDDSSSSSDEDLNVSRRSRNRNRILDSDDDSLECLQPCPHIASHQDLVIQPERPYIYGKNKHKWATTPRSSNTRASAPNIIHFVPGPTSDARDLVEPIPIFHLYLSDEMIDQLVIYTNAEIEIKKVKYKELTHTISPTSAIELKALLGLLMQSAAIKTIMSSKLVKAALRNAGSVDEQFSVPSLQESSEEVWSDFDSDDSVLDKDYEVPRSFNQILHNSDSIAIPDLDSIGPQCSSSNTQEQIQVVPQSSSSDTQEPIQDVANSSSYKQQVAVEFPHQYKNALAEFKTEVQRFTKLFETNPTIHNLRALGKFANIIKKNNTSEQGQNFILNQIITRRVPRKIKVQSAALSRRKDRGIGKTKSRIQAERPSNTERRTKRKHNLGQNVKMNVRNAR
ncbi:hypothetical protein HW555_012949 [Spodoptera exigua]|uniref:MADF domain-containing protein n=1 Tax=Spodoptera exigua TaxID=7107 RepID=A0A835G4H6_SPOEX|nr:hypothetical protein HW555_012949 [Spodoptera exigua]